MELGKRRNKTYVWVTWITGLLSGTEQCSYRAWVKANYQLPKGGEKDADDRERLDQYLREHDAMTAARVKLLQTQGWLVKVEDDNSFKLEGQKAILGGKPDIVALRPDGSEALIVDEKSGKAKEKYVWQVILYMIAMSFTHLKGIRRIRGEVEYKNNSIPVAAEQLNEENRNKFKAMMLLMGSETAPEPVPSANECRFCDVIGCHKRFVVRNESADVSNLF